jgi:hypothetical protein
MLCNTGQKRVARYHTLDAPGSQALEVASVINFFCPTIANKQWLGIIFTLIQVFTNPFSSFGTYENRAVFLAFAAHGKFAAFEVYMVAI